MNQPVLQDFSYDPFDPDVMANPLPYYRRLRDEHPVYYIEKWDTYALSRFDDIWNLLGLTDVRTIHPLNDALEREDSDRDLWFSNPDQCCYIRKVEPLNRALSHADAWMTGQRREQAARAAAQPVDPYRREIRPGGIAVFGPDGQQVHWLSTAHLARKA